MEDMVNISFQSGGDTKTRTTNGDQTIYDWSIDDLKTLCARIKDASLRLAKAVNAPYSRTENRLDWESIAFGEHDSKECHTKWQQLCTNIRTFRTMSEILEDAEQWLQKGPRKAKEAKVKGKSHPDKPSRPPTIFFKFLMEQLPKVKVKYPELTHKQIVSKIGEMYKHIPPKKLSQLKAEFLKDQEAYRARLEEFYNEHPDVAPSRGPTNASPRGTSGLAFFIAEKMKDPRYADASKEDLRIKWSKLKDERKVQFIEMALSAHRKSAGLINFIAKPAKDVLSKDERLVYDRFLGKPEKPPTSGFALYKNVAGATKFKDMNVADRNEAIQQAWNGMSRPDQNKFNNEAKIIKQQYDRKMEEYLKRLAEREQRLTESGMSTHLNHNGPDTSTVANGASAPKRPKLEMALSPKKIATRVVVPVSKAKKIPQKFSALTWYQESCLDEWRELNPELSEHELRAAIAEQFSDFSEKKKHKWARKAEEENQRRGLH